MGIENFREQYPEAEELRLSDLTLENPEKKGFEFDPEEGISDDDWMEMKQAFETLKEGDWEAVTDQAICLKIIFPNRVSELNLDEEASQGIKQKLKTERGRDWWNFSGIAMRLKILAAKEVRITDNGLELVMPEKKGFQKEEKPRPERKKF